MPTSTGSATTWSRGLPLRGRRRPARAHAHQALFRNNTPGLRATRDLAPCHADRCSASGPCRSPSGGRPARPARPLCRAGMLERSIGGGARGWTCAPTPTTGAAGGWSATSPPASTARHRRRPRPRPRDQLGLLLAGPADRARTSRPGARPRHRLRRQALHLGEHAAHRGHRRQRAGPRVTRLNAVLNGIDVDDRAGSLYDPVAGESSTWSSPTRRSWSRPAPGSDWSTATPVSPATRWSAASSPAPPTPSPPAARAGAGQLGAPHRRVLEEQLAGWVEGRGVDAWVVQREVADPAGTSALAQGRRVHGSCLRFPL